MTALALSLLALPGCSGKDAAGDVALGVPEDAAARQSIRLDVYPPTDQPSALPQTFRDRRLDGNLGTVSLAPAVRVGGTVSAYQVTPWLGANLPGKEIPVSGSVILRQEGAIQGYHLLSDDDGRVSAPIVPGTYTTSFVPTDPLVPFATIDLELEDADEGALDLNLGEGVALWGVVTDAKGEPMAGVAVQAVDASGTAGTATLTDETGRYELRVLSDTGLYQVVAAGRAERHGLDPVVGVSNVVVGDAGAQVDVAYGPLEEIQVGGGAVDEAGNGIANVVVRFTAVELLDFATSDDAGHPISTSSTVTAETTGTGLWDVRLLPGTWQVDLIPPTDSSYGSLSLGEVTLLGNTVFQPEALDPFVSVVGTVTAGSEGVPAPGARVSCSETGFGGRYWSGIADDTGAYSLFLPEAPLSCVVTPATNDLGFGLVATDLDPAGAADADFVLPYATTYTGTLVLGENPVGFAVVEARDPNSGALLASTLSDPDGNFSLPIP